MEDSRDFDPARFTRLVSNRDGGGRVRKILGDLYIASLWFFVFGIYGVALLGAVSEILAEDPGDGSHGGTGSLGTVDASSMAMVAVVALGVALLVRVGPVSVTGPQGIWWLGLPVGRRRLLQGRYFRLLAVAVIVAVVAFLPVGISGSKDLVSLLASLTLSGLLGAASFCFAAYVQLRGLRDHVLRVCMGIVAAVPVAILMFAFVDAVGFSLSPATSALKLLPTFWPVLAMSGNVPWELAVPLMAVVVLFVHLFSHRLDDLRTEELKEAGNTTGYFAASLFFLDFRSAGLALGTGHGGPPRHRMLRLRGVNGAFLSAIGTPFLRSSNLAAKTAAICLVPGAVLSVQTLSTNAAMALSILVCGAVACRFAAASAMPLAERPRLETYFSLSASRARWLHLVFPALYLATWSATTFAAVALWIPIAPLLGLQIVLAVAGMAGASLRWAHRPSQDLSTPQSVQRTALSGLIHGADAYLMCAAPLVGALYAGNSSPLLLIVQMAVGIVAVAWGTKLPRRKVRFQDLA